MTLPVAINHYLKTFLEWLSKTLTIKMVIAIEKYRFSLSQGVFNGF
jgi:hypothetical protein